MTFNPGHGLIVPDVRELWVPPAPNTAPAGPAATKMKTLNDYRQGGAALRHVIEGDSLSIGRATTNDLVVPDRDVSRHHARIEKFEDGYRLIDMRSRFGTLLNGQRLQNPAVLSTGDRIEIGRSVLVFDEDEEDSEITAPSRKDRWQPAEFREAGRIQQALLPAHPPAIDGYDVDGATFPCSEVGGDYFDYLPMPEGRTAIAVADVAGRGLPAALIMCSFQASLRALAEFEFSLDALVERLNRLMYLRMPSNRFVTLFYGVLDPFAHTLTYVNAGHNSPCLIRSGGAVEVLPLGGQPVGMVETVRASVQTVSLEAGDALVCLSDGIIETADPSDDLFGSERLVELLAGLRGVPSRDVSSRILAAVDEHRGPAPQQDDATLVIVRRLEA